MRLFLFLPVLSVACLPMIGDGGGRDCDAMAVPSVRVQVEVPGGGEPDGLEVSIDGVEECELLDGQTYVCGWERSGELVIVADAVGYARTEATVQVPQGECHVETQDLVITLEEVICPPVTMIGVEVETVSAAGESIEATVEWLPLDGGMYTSPMPCEDWGSTYGCAENTGGEIEIWATSRGHGSFYEVVDVPVDDCGPITQRITAVVDRDPG